MVHQNQTSTVDTMAIPVVSVSPVTLPTPDQIADIQMRIVAPADGNELPVILLSHGHRHSNHLSSLNGNLPMMDYWAAHGFIVIQPTHLDSKTLNLY